MLTRTACWNCASAFATTSGPHVLRCEPEQVIITAGTQQALDIVIRVLHGPDKEVWIEDPGYSLNCLALVAAGAEGSPDNDQYGINVAQHIRRAPRARAVFITPSASVSERRGPVDGTPPRTSCLGARVRRLDRRGRLRQRIPLWRPTSRHFRGLDEAERAIYTGTLNKALFPGLRLGYAVVSRFMDAQLRQRPGTASRPAFARSRSPYS